VHAPPAELHRIGLESRYLGISAADLDDGLVDRNPVDTTGSSIAADGHGYADSLGETPVPGQISGKLL
jgi:hypothetical protein